jgi:hypothetical protein
MDLFNKRFNTNDPYNYLPSNMTLGTEQWWAQKFGNKLPDGYLYLLETMSRKEYTDEDVAKAKQLVVQQQLEYNARVEKELADLGLLNQQKSDEKSDEKIDEK